MINPPVPVVWLSLARYNNPLNATDARKWAFLAEHLTRPISVIAFSPTWRGMHFEQGARFYLIPNIPFAPLRYVLFALAVLGLVLWLVLRRNAQVVIAQSPYDGAVASLAIGITRWFGKRPRLIVEAHDDFANKVFLMRRVPLEPLVRALLSRVARFSIRRADALRPVAQSLETTLRAIAPNTPQVRFTAWTDVGAFAQATRTTPLSEAQTLVYVGVITPVKGIHTLIEAFAQLDARWQLMLIGAEVAPAYSATLRERITALHLTERVQWTGKLSQQAVAQHLVNARLFVLPSQSEGLPRVVIEAMVCYTPIVATAVDGIPEMVIPHETGWLCPANDVPALRDAVNSALNADLPTLERITANAHALAQDLFSPQRYLDGYRQLIEVACR